MKKALAILLLIVFTFNMAGYFIAFKIQQLEVRKEIKQQIKLGVPEGELIRITVNAANKHEFEWEHAREFHYKGSMYDVIRKEVIDEATTIYYCINDTKESILFANLDEQVEQQMDTKNKNHPEKNLFKILSGIFFQPHNTKWILPQINIKINYHFSYNHSSPALAIASPPPKTV